MRGDAVTWALRRVGERTLSWIERMPLTFLSGVFYSIHSLPPFWQALSHFNPFFYMIDGFRYGFFGLSDVAPVLSLALVAAAAVILAALALLMLARGWKLRH